MLQEGDVVELKAGMEVYADIPKHFVYSNRRGDFSMTHNNITLGGQFDYLCGKYVVTKTFMGGGGQSHDGGYPDGWHVFCVKVDDEKVKVDFYQSGCFTAMIENIEPVGKATLKWSAG